MKRALLVFMALVVPFFSQAESIFNQGNTVPPITADVFTFDCFINVTTNIISSGSVVDDDIKQKHSYCLSATKTAVKSQIDLAHQSDTCYSSASLSTTTWEDTHFIVNYTYTYRDWRNQCSQGISGGQTGVTNELFETTNGCTDETNNYPVDTNSGDAACADPNQIPLYDSCDVNDSPPVQVTELEACYSKPDGSICSVTAVDVGGGNKVYMGSEGNCYTDPKPDISNNDPQGEPNPDGTCTDNGGLLACPEDPENVCNASGSNYGGGSVNNCQSGCGYVNETFTCYDTDIDNDGLPDYNDPDKDGDGVPNKDDLDSDGDGKDDPIHGDGDGNGSGGGAVDMSGVIDAINKFKNDAVNKQEIADGSKIKEQLENKNTELETKTQEFFDSTDLAGINGFVENNGISADFFQIQAKMAGSNCINPSHAAMGEVPLCTKIANVRPYLYIAFGLGTFIFLMFRFGQVVRGNK